MAVMTNEQSNSATELGDLNGTKGRDRDEENESLLDEHENEADGAVFEKVKEPEQSGKVTAFWMAINIVATVLIVFTNKAIFEDKSLKYIQISFAAFHFSVTFLALYVLSLDRFAYFEPKHATIGQMIPLSIAMALNVIFPNLSLAYSTVTFYQIARILLTPCVAALDYFLYRVTMPFAAAIALVPACLGVGMVSYYDSRPSADAKVKTTTSLGVIFALTGVFFSSLYTVWIAAFRKRLSMSSMQLLLNQAPVSVFILLYAIPIVDKFPVWTQVPFSRWFLILLSGFLAVLINVSQFFIIAQSGPVSSTVVGHSKTCIIVVLGWLSSGRTVADMSVVGLLVALGGIFGYSVIIIREKKKAAGAK